MTIIDLTSGRDVEIEDEPISLAERLAEDDALGSRQQFSAYRQRVLIRFDDRAYTVDEFRAWVRRLADVETSTDPAKANVVKQMRDHIRQQDETASAVVGALSGQIRELQDDLRRVKAERDELITHSAPAAEHERGTA